MAERNPPGYCPRVPPCQLSSELFKEHLGNCKRCYSKWCHGAAASTCDIKDDLVKNNSYTLPDGMPEGKKERCGACSYAKWALNDVLVELIKDPYECIPYLGWAGFRPSFDCRI